MSKLFGIPFEHVSQILLHDGQWHHVEPLSLTVGTATTTGAPDGAVVTWRSLSDNRRVIAVPSRYVYAAIGVNQNPN